MKKKRKYTRRVPLKTVSKQPSPYKFVIDTDWTPSKAYGNNEYMDAIVSTAASLLSKESFAVPMIELKKLCGYANGHSAAASIRTALSRVVGKKEIGSYGTHVVKDHSGNHIAVRVRKK